MSSGVSLSGYNLKNTVFIFTFPNSVDPGGLQGLFSVEIVRDLLFFLQKISLKLA